MELSQQKTQQPENQGVHISPSSKSRVPKITSSTINSVKNRTPPCKTKKSKKSKPITKRRSRKGCINCKRLKIKCNEGKPSCEYCLDRRKECIYPEEEEENQINQILTRSEDVPNSKSVFSQEQAETSFQFEHSIPLDFPISLLPSVEISSYSTGCIPSSTSSHEVDYCHSLPISGTPDQSSTPGLLFSVDDFIGNIEADQTYELFACHHSSPSHDPVFNRNQIIQKLNSMKTHLNVTTLELRLLKFFQQFGSTFFSLGHAPKVEVIWAVDVPELWKTSEMVRNALYALSSVKLWGFYQTGGPSGGTKSGFETIARIFEDIDDDICTDGSLCINNDLCMMEKIGNYFIRALDSVNNFKPSTDLDSNLKVIITNTIIFAFLSIHPSPPTPLICFEEYSFLDEASIDLSIASRTNNFRTPLDIFSVFHTLSRSFGVSFDYTLGTKYENLAYFDQREVLVEEEDRKLFPFTNHLKSYVENLNNAGLIIDTSNYLTYINAVNIIHTSCFVSFKRNYPIPIFKAILKLSDDTHFAQLLRQRDHIACKILFYYTSLLSMLGFKIFPTESTWDKFNNFYCLHCFSLFQTFWEDSIDENILKLIKYVGINRDLFLVKGQRYMGMLTAIGEESVHYVDQLGNMRFVDLRYMKVDF